MNKIYKIRVKGNYTVEAALLFPLVIFVIIGIIYLGFYLHDLGKVQAIVDESQIRSKGLVRSEVNINTGILSYSNYLDRTIFYPIDNNLKAKENQIKNYIKTKSKKQLFISKISIINVELTPSKSNIRVNLDFTFPFSSIETLFIGSENMVIESTEKIHDPMSFIRGYDVASSAGKKIDVVNQVVSQLQELINFLK